MASENVYSKVQGLVETCFAKSSSDDSVVANQRVVSFVFGCVDVVLLTYSERTRKKLVPVSVPLVALASHVLV